MIGIFPEFSRLDISHKDEVEAITKQYEPYSDFNFTSLFSWNVDNTTEVAIFNQNLIIRLPHYTTGDPVISMLGDNDISSTIKGLLAIIPNLNLIPEAVITNLGPTSKYTVEEARGDYDYIYDLESLVNMAGSDYKKKRNKVNRVKLAFGSRIKVTTTNTISNIHDIELAFTHWAAQNGKLDRDTKIEYTALSRLLHHADLLNVWLTTISLDGQLCGFSINEPLDHGYTICHFEKSISSHPDMAAYLAYVVAQELLNRGYKKVNWEQDLDIAGLRQAKLSYKPAYFLKKYTVSIN
jgi:hypothetical protein